MDGCSSSVKKSPYVKEWMAQADIPKEANPVKKMNILSSMKMAHYFKEWKLLTVAVCKNTVPLKRINAKLRRSSSLEKVAVPKVTFDSANAYNCYLL